MKKLAIAVGLVALACASASPLRADVAVVMFKDGHCQPWVDSGVKPWGAGWKYHWVGLKSWQAAEGKRHYAMRRHWCKSFS